MRVVLARRDPARPESKLEPLAILKISEMAMSGLWLVNTQAKRATPG